MKKTRFGHVSAVIAGLALTALAQAQHGFAQTTTVDPSGSADRTTITLAIGLIPPLASGRWTIFIYAGTYAENVDLDDAPAAVDVDLVGVDRDSVIIAPTSGVGIDCRANNSIRNLTVTVTGSVGILCGNNTNMQNLTVNLTGNTGILCGNNNSIRNVTVIATGTSPEGIRLSNDCEVINVTVDASGGTASTGIILGNGANPVSRVSIERSIVKATQRAIWDPVSLSTDIVVRDCHFETDGSGSGTVAMAHAQRTLFENCTILNDGSNDPNENPVALLIGGVGNIPFDILLQGCRITAIGAGVNETIAVQNTLDPGLRLLNCKITAESKHATSEGAGAIGVDGKAIVIGGEIITSAISDKATEVWDLREHADPEQDIFMSGTLLSKWKGPISRPAPQGKKSVVQRILNVPAASTTAIHPGITLDMNEQTVAPTGQPGGYRVLTVTGNDAGMNQPVYIVGTDWADNKIVDKITLNGTNTVLGKKPFKTVTEIIVQPFNNPGEEVSVGTSTWLGFYVPIELIGDVVAQSHLAPLGTAWIVGSVGFAAVDFIYATVDVGSFPTGTGFRFSVLTPK
ncbi:MAG: hypothetical protein IH851_05710 [Armatimonadetes bacterium]|nr:hypothetical protein [Armatimonadota bacterium]